MLSSGRHGLWVRNLLRVMLIYIQVCRSIQFVSNNNPLSAQKTSRPPRNPNDWLLEMRTNCTPRLGMGGFPLYPRMILHGLDFML
jgi:hypothetical protein